MGFAVARAAHEAGAQVTLVSGPVGLATPRGVARVNVQSARDMRDAVMSRVQANEVFIAVAAVADYRPAEIAQQKIKRSRELPALEPSNPIRTFWPKSRRCRVRRTVSVSRLRARTSKPMRRPNAPPRTFR